MKKPKPKPKEKAMNPKIDPNQLKTRDYLMLKVISGVTKAGVQKDRRKEADKKACRKPVKEDE